MTADPDNMLFQNNDALENGMAAAAASKKKSFKIACSTHKWPHN